MGRGIVGVQRDGFMEAGDAPRHARGRAPGQVVPAELERTVPRSSGDHVAGRRALEWGDFLDERGHDRIGHRVLGRELIGQVKVVALGAEVRSGVVEVLDADSGSGSLHP